MDITTPAYYFTPYGTGARVYALDRTMLRVFINYLGSTRLETNNNRLFVDAASYILSIGMYPWIVGHPLMPKREMQFAGLPVPMDDWQTEANYLQVWDCLPADDPLIGDRYATLPTPNRVMGMVHIDPYYNDFRDYLTNINLWVPLVGFVPLDPAIVTGHDVYVTFVTDYITNTTIYHITLDDPIRFPISDIDPTVYNPRILHSGDVNVAMSIPIGQSNAADIKRNVLTSTGNAVMGGLTSVVLGGMAGGAAGAITAGIGAAAGAIMAYGNASMQPRAMRTMPIGGGFTSYVGCNRVTAVIERRVSEMPDNYAHTYGRPLMETRTLGNLTGYTKVSEVHPDGIPCTDIELSEIEQLLKTGVIL